MVSRQTKQTWSAPLFDSHIYYTSQLNVTTYQTLCVETFPLKNVTYMDVKLGMRRHLCNTKTNSRQGGLVTGLLALLDI